MPIKTKGFAQSIKNMQARSTDFKGGKPYDEIGKVASASIKKNVDSAGRPKWRKRKGSYPWPILNKTSTMRNRAESTALRWVHGAKIHVNKIFGPDYGLIHQYTGVKTKIGSKVSNIVRKYVLFQKAEVKKMQDAFRKSFLRK